MTKEYIEDKIKLYDDNCMGYHDKDELKYMFYLGKLDAWKSVLNELYPEHIDSYKEFGPKVEIIDKANKLIYGEK